LDGAGYSIIGTGAWAIDARAYDVDRVTLSKGANAFTNLLVNNVMVSGFAGGVNASGNADTDGLGVNAGYGGTGGDIEILYSTIGSVLANGGNASTKPYGGAGGNIIFTDDDLDMSSSTISALGGSGSSGRNTDGGLDLNYTGALSRTGLLLSSLSFFNDNATSYGVYPGGSWPMTPGLISSCGTLYGAGTYTLTQNISNISGTCFTIGGDNVVLNGAGYSISSADASTTAFAIQASGYSSFTLASTTVLNYPNLIISSSSVAITGQDVDISNRFIAVSSLSIAYSGNLSKEGATSIALSQLSVNGISYGSTFSGPLLEFVARGVSANWGALASSADGTKLVGVIPYNKIYTSTDSGATWTPRFLTGAWQAVASSADGTKLAAVVSGGQIYTSTDSGLTWTARDSNRSWTGVASSADGTRLVAGVNGGKVYTSADSGATWTARDSSRAWLSIASSADGSKLVAGMYGGLIYVSSDYGVTWIPGNAPSLAWKSVASSADGTKLAAVVQNGQIYTSTDSGATWTARDSSRNWYSIASSADGTKLAAVVYGSGRVYASADSGATWTARDSNRNWSAVTSSADGSKLVAATSGGYIFTSQNLNAPVSIHSPVSGDISSWSPTILWNNYASCYYSYDSFASTSTVNCLLGGTDIPNPGYGAGTLSVRGVSTTGVVSEAGVSFTFRLPITVSSPLKNSTVTAWSPSIDWDSVEAGNISSCHYSYDGFVSTTTVSCDLSGTDILAPAGIGTSTLSLRVFDANGLSGSIDIPLTYAPAYAWVPRESTRNWRSVASSADGTKLVAAVQNGQIYTSTDSGATWTARDSNRDWWGVSSSADGTKLAAVASGGQIYVSTNSGVSWTARETNRTWRSVASSADGTKLAAVVSGGQIYTSTDSGATWTARDSNRDWWGVSSSADGTRLVAGVNGGKVYTSADSGATWTARDSNRNWRSIASSADGTRLAAAVYNGFIYVSTDSGLTWSPRGEGKNWQAITSSADGSRLTAVAYNGQIYTSINSGVTWVANDSDRVWHGIASSADGTKLAAVAEGGRIYTYDGSGSVSIGRPVSTGSLLKREWSPLVNWFDSTLCYYSYDGFVSTSTVSCANSGTDIPPPATDGTQILSVRGINSLGIISNRSAMFSYEPWVALESVRNWAGSASSADGTKLAAVVFGGQIYTSTDSGATWTARDSSRNWYSIASSADGTKLVAVVQNGQVYTSTNSGLNWTARDSSREWWDVSSSADGTKLAAVAAGGRIYTSTNSGASWTARDSNRAWLSVASSADGTKLVAAVQNGQVYTSTDSGATWTARDSNRAWYSVASSADGTRLAATVNNGQVYTSTNSGLNWTARESNRAWRSISSSADGTRLAATVNNGQVYTSADSGATWTARESIRNWSSVSMSSDASRVFATAYGAQIYRFGLVVSMTAPALNSTVTTWAPVVSWGNAAVCEYSHDGSAWASSSCAGTGSDILAPSLIGSSTLNLRGFDFQGDIATTSRSFIYLPILSPGDISSCGSITTAGTYTLSGDITGVSGTCFVVSSSNVTIDGAGYSVFSVANNPGYGVNGASYSNLTLRDIHFSGFGTQTVASNLVIVTGSDVDISSTTIATYGLNLSYSNSLTATGAYFPYAMSLILNGINLGSFSGPFSWSSQDVSACGTLSDPGMYTLTQDILDVSGTCFFIESPAIIIDGDGHTISGANGNADYAFVATAPDSDGYNNIAITNLVLTGFGGGIDARGANGVSGFNDGKAGGTVSLYGVSFPTSTVSAIVSGGDSFFESSTPYEAGNSGGVYIASSTVGGLVANGGDVDNGGQVDLGYYNGEYYGPTAGAVYNQGGTVSIATTSLRDGRGYIPGCMDPGFGNYRPDATYNDGSCNSLTVGTQRDNPVGEEYSGDVVFWAFSNYGVVNGGAEFHAVDYNYNYSSTATGNYGTTTGDASFIDDWGSGSGPDNYGFIGGYATFNGWSRNYGVVHGATFDYAGNHGIVEGDVIFLGSGYNNNDGVINGNADFAYNNVGAFNYGTVNGNATFYANDDSYGRYNFGTVTGTVSYLYGCTDPLAINYEPSALYDNGFCVLVGTSSDNPSGSTVAGPITFRNGYSNYGTVTGDAIFEGGSYNYATVTGDATFYDITSTAGVLYVSDSFYGTGIVGGTLRDSASEVISSIEILDGAIVSGVVDADSIVFNGSTINYDVTYGTTTFDDFSLNMGQVNGDAIFNTTMYASTSPSGGRFPLENNSLWLGTVTGTVYGSDMVPVTDYDFYDSSINMSAIAGNAHFNDNSYSQGTTISGNVTINSTYYHPTVPTTSTFRLSGSAYWRGTVGGTMFASDGTTPMTNFVFTGSSANNGTITGTATFSDLASNNSTIIGDAVFTNTSPFRVGTVTGTTTLSGISQTILSVNNVFNLIKQIFSRDTLYIQAGGSLNVSGLLTLLGFDSGNLLTIKSTTPGVTANLGINGSSTLDFLRIKDIRNSGSSLSLVGKTIYDDGGNVGFTFNSNSQPSSRGSLTSGATRPPTPNVRASEAAAAAAIRAALAAASVRTTSLGTASALVREFRKATAESLSTVSLPVSLVGRLPALTALPVFGGTGKNSFSFQAPISKFLFVPVSETALSSISTSPRLAAYVRSIGVSSAQSFARIHVSPKIVALADSAIPGLYSVSVDGKPVQTEMTSDGGEVVFQQVRVAPGAIVEVSVSPVNGNDIVARFDGKSIQFGATNSVSISAPLAPGSYLLTSSASPLSLAVRVSAPVSQAKPQASGSGISAPESPPARSLWGRLLGLFGIR